MYEVQYYERVNRRWVRAGRYDSQAKADEVAGDLRMAGYEARVTEVQP